MESAEYELYRRAHKIIVHGRKSVSMPLANNLMADLHEAIFRESVPIDNLDVLNKELLFLEKSIHDVRKTIRNLRTKPAG